MWGEHQFRPTTHVNKTRRARETTHFMWVERQFRPSYKYGDSLVGDHPLYVGGASISTYYRVNKTRRAAH